MTEQEKKSKVKELFVKDLARIRGGTAPAKDPKCPDITSFVCGEEPHGCSGC